MGELENPTESVKESIRESRESPKASGKESGKTAAGAFFLGFLQSAALLIDRRPVSIS